MRLTFGDQIRICQDGAGKDITTASQTFFKRHINSRDNFCVSKLPSHLTETTRTFSTVADQPYYHYPPNIKGIKSLVVSVGSVDYPLEAIHSNNNWASINAVDFQANALPQYYFKRQRDFGIWPIPADAYTTTIEYSIRGGNLVRTDYTTGTVTVTENDETVTEAGASAWSTTSNLQPDDWFVLTDSNGEPRGNWYRIASVTTAYVLELESVFEETTEAGATYKIGQCSELPEDYHELPAWGALMDYYLSFRQSPGKAIVWSNMFYTGTPDTSKSQAEAGRKPWTGGGLIGMINDYRNRNESQIINRGTKLMDPRLKVWGTTLS
ncbi:MAG: phage adaptor protein [Planctomycetota bacterium]|jgi:hypothetical protein